MGITEAKWSPGGTLLALGSGDSKIRWLEAPTWECAGVCEIPSKITKEDTGDDGIVRPQNVPWLPLDGKGPMLMLRWCGMKLLRSRSLVKARKQKSKEVATYLLMEPLPRSAPWCQSIA